MTNQFRQSILSGLKRDPNPVAGTKAPRGQADHNVDSLDIPREEIRTHNHRFDDRHRLADEAVSVIHRGTAYPVELVNLSDGGAMIVAGFAPRLYDRVELSLGEGMPLDCAVLWLKGDRIGLEFAHETVIGASQSDREGLLRAVLRRSFPDYQPPTRAASEDELDQPADELPDPSAQSRRGERRHPLIWSGLLHVDHDSHKVRLRNISATGALIEGAGQIREGAELLLDLGNDLTLFARLLWVRGDQAGLAFDTPFAIERLAEAKPEVASHRWTPPSFLDGAARGHDPWNRASVDELRDSLEGFLKR